MNNIPLAKDYGSVGERCARHPYENVDLEYENFYGFLNVWFGGQGSLYTTEETFNAGMWYELPNGKTLTKRNAESLSKILEKKNAFWRTIIFEDKSHIFIM